VKGWEVDVVSVAAEVTDEVIYRTVVVAGVVVEEIQERLAVVGGCLVVPDVAAPFLALALPLPDPVVVGAGHTDLLDAQ
jgi:hypothetical protein